MARAAIAFVLLLLVPGVPGGRQAEPRMLFIGNSLTYWNELPAMVEALATAAKRHITVQMVAFPDVSLEDHWQRGDAVRAIRRGGWSHVVLQQGPSALPESQKLLREYTRKFDAEIKAVKATTALYMVWPSRARQQDFDGVSASYGAAARDVDGLLLPVGDAWRTAWKRDPGLALYSPDGLHPSRAGSYLAALIIVSRSLRIAPIGLPALGVEPGTAKLLQEVAEAMARPPAAWSRPAGHPARR
jgi:hypothetical protein